jgi:predicted deacetylase
MSRKLAVALHDVEPRSFTRCREIRRWLLDREIKRITLLVIPGADLHPIGSRAPALAAWLRNRVACGDTVAQHGLAHRACTPARWPRNLLASWQGGDAAEFPGLGAEDTARRVQTGRRLLREIELDPRGFVAPGYAYTRALRAELAGSFEWFADLRSVQLSQRQRLASPALCLGASTALKRALSPAYVRFAASRSVEDLMRLDIHPADFDLRRHVATLESVLAGARMREPVTYDQLLD